MIQRLGLGVLLVHSPDVLILDEPASGLDPKARIDLRSVMKRLSAEGKTVMISSHILTELSGLCSHMAVMNQGEIVHFGRVEDIERQVMGARAVKITVLDDCDRAVKLIQDFDGVRNVEVLQAHTIAVMIDKGPEGIAELNRKLVQSGINVISLFQEPSNLEDVYLKISSQSTNPPGKIEE